MGIKDRLKKRRRQLGMTIEDVARLAGVSSATVSRWETGDIENMRLDKIALLAKALQVTPSYIMGWDKEENTTDTGITPFKLDKSKLVKRLEEIRGIARGDLTYLRIGSVIKTKADGTLTPRDELDEITDLLDELIIDLEMDEV